MVVADAPNPMADAPAACLPQSAVGSFYRRPPNPRLIAGRAFSDGAMDTAITDPDLRWDGSLWHLYYSSPHGTTFDPPGPTIIRHATSADLAAWTFDDTPALNVSGVHEPSVVENPGAPADQRYLMLYTFDAGPALAAAFSADGITFTSAGLVLDGNAVYAGDATARVGDPELALLGSTYHLWFSSSGANAYGISHATSTDGTHWTVDAAPVPSLLRTSADKKTGGAKPSVIYDDVHCRWEMWLSNDQTGDTSTQSVQDANTAGLWHATSTNGTTWTLNYTFARDFVWDGTAAGEHLGMRAGADVAMKSTGRYMVYVGYDNQNVPSGATYATTLDLATRDAP